MVEEDYIMRIISDIVKALAKTFLGKKEIIYELPPEETKLSGEDRLYQKLMQLLEEDDICGAEDALYEDACFGSKAWYEVALIFYNKVNEKSEDYLEEHDYSRAEIKEGLKEATKVCDQSHLADLIFMS